MQEGNVICYESLELKKHENNYVTIDDILSIILIPLINMSKESQKFRNMVKSPYSSVEIPS